MGETANQTDACLIIACERKTPLPVCFFTWGGETSSD